MYETVGKICQNEDKAGCDISTHIVCAKCVDVIRCETHIYLPPRAVKSQT